MTVVNFGNGLWYGLSTDTKPSVSAGSRFFESDTGDTLLSDGTYWWLSGFPSPFSPRRIGILSPGPSMANGAIGLCSALSPATGAGGTNNSISFTDTTNGRYYLGITGTTVANRGGARQGSIVTTWAMNPKVRFKFKLVTNTNQNFWLGFIGGVPTEPSGVGVLSAGSPGIMFGVNSGLATNWAIMNNGTSGSAVVTDTGIAYDTNIHTVNLVGDSANTRFAWNIDGGAYSFVTTTASLPTTTNGLGLVAEIEAEETVAKSFQLYEMSIQTEK
jgi:hypothetical protein